MPKLKTNSGAKKRFRTIAKSASGKAGYVARGAKRNHMMMNKTTKMKRHARAGLRVRDEDLGRIRQLMPYTK